jgi:hypothetical protein
MLFETGSIGDLETLQYLTIVTQNNNFKGEISKKKRQWVQLEQNL